MTPTSHAISDGDAEDEARDSELNPKKSTRLGAIESESAQGPDGQRDGEPCWKECKRAQPRFPGPRDAVPVEEEDESEFDEDPESAT